MARRIVLALSLALVAAAPAQALPAPGAPGERTAWVPANKEGFGTSHTTGSKVWFTLHDGALSEVYYPNLSTPSVRSLQLVVSDGRSFVDAESEATLHTISLPDRRALLYRQVSTDRQGRYRITKTWATGIVRNALVVRVRFESLDGKPYQVHAVYDPALNNTGGNDRGATVGRVLVATDGRAKVASALNARPRFRKTSSGFLGTSDGLRDLRRDGRMDWTYDSAGRGNVVQTALTSLNGRPGRQELTMSIGFGANAREARSVSRDPLVEGFEILADRYARTWHTYLDSLPPAPASVAGHRDLYDASLMVLAASEDKTFRGASIASPSMPWAWGDGTVEKPSGPYHLVWPRDLYQVATAQLAAGDRASAERLLTFLFRRAQKKDGSFAQNTEVDGTEHWTSLQMDEVALPIVLAWQLERSGRRAWSRHIRRAADFIVRKGPETEQERWENQSGWSPGTIAAEIAGLVCAADIARRNGDTARAGRYERAADRWQRNVERWTATSNGPFSPRPYYLRVTKDHDPNRGTRYAIGDTGPKRADQRTVVDPSFLELVRLGVKRFDDPVVLNSIAVVDRKLGVDTPFGPLWHRFTYDGYGETRRGGQWTLEDKAKRRTLGRAWPLFAGERGEYELLAGRPAAAHLDTIAGTAGDGLMLPEQVWDGRPPTGRPGFEVGKGTFSATPLAWTHAQFVRLAWSIEADRPVEQPSIVACRYVGCWARPSAGYSPSSSSR